MISFKTRAFNLPVFSAPSSIRGTHKRRCMSSDEEGVFHFDKDFHGICHNSDVLKKACEKLIADIIDFHTLGLVFEQHKKWKTNAWDKDIVYDPEKLNPPPLGVEIFGNGNMKKNLEVSCPNCQRVVAAVKFAQHLEGCMGIGRRRNTTRRVGVSSNVQSNPSTSSKEKEGTGNASFGGTASDDDDNDMDWYPDKRRKKKEGRNGGKKGTPKKNSEAEQESANVDVEGDDDDD